MSRLATMIAAFGLLVAASIAPMLASSTASLAQAQVTTTDSLDAYAAGKKAKKSAKKSKKSAKKSKKAKKSAKKGKKTAKKSKKAKKSAKRGKKAPAKKKGKSADVIFFRNAA